ncbi:MAG: SIS domain-containing protein [Clostridia bacterium]|nr:SIS domain-containing protein [Clostridia bacterium]
MKETTKTIYEELFTRYPSLTGIADDVMQAFCILKSCYEKGGKILVGGNGGSAADSEHIVGELLKSFKKPRAIDETVKANLSQSKNGEYLLSKLEGALPAVSLVSQTSILTAYANDKAWDTALAQQTYGLGRAGDCLIVLSTSGNSRNCVLAAEVAKAKEMQTIAFTGQTESELSQICSLTLRVPEIQTYKVQELHVPIYHCLCAMLEEELF